MLPPDAKFEAEIAGGVALYDVADLLPRHPTKRYRRRPVEAIVRQYHHHSGALGRPGYEGAYRSALYIVRPEWRGWPGAPYHYWLSHAPDRDAQRRLAVYRLQPDAVRSYHTGARANTHGIGVCWQGDLSRTEPSPAQVEMAEALVPWLIERHELAVPDGISWHSEAGRWGGKGKPACPGPHVERWLREYREAAA